ncbi:MAG TPA: lactonase family protein [Opitutaceae bacterium]|nr:lactonase family protein [Opitutaceae bacterium]
MASSHLIYFGTYTRSASRGIYAARLDAETGALTPPQLVAETPNPTWLTLTPDKKFLYAVNGSKAQAVGYAVDAATGNLTPLPVSADGRTPAPGPAHLAVDATGRVLLAANYGDGYVASIPIHSDGTLGSPFVVPHTGHGPNPMRQEKPHVHCVTPSPDNRFVFVCDLGLDKIFTYALDPATAKLTAWNPPFVEGAPATGPRHLKFSPDGRHAYNVTEMGATVVVYDYDAARGVLTPVQTVSTVPPDYQAKWAAEVALHPNGRFLYASNRGQDTIVVFTVDPQSGKLTQIQSIPSGGAVPRHFALSPHGHWLVCGHQFSDQITVFRVDPNTGRLTPTPHTITVPMCVCVRFFD